MPFKRIVLAVACTNARLKVRYIRYDDLQIKSRDDMIFNAKMKEYIIFICKKITYLISMTIYPNDMNFNICFASSPFVFYILLKLQVKHSKCSTIKE